MTDKTRRNVLVIGGIAGAGLMSGLYGVTADEHDDDDDNDDEDDDSENGDDTGGDDEETETEEGEDGLARVRVAHLSPDAPAVDVYVEGDAVLEGVEFKGISDYLELEPGTYSVAVVPAGEPQDEAVIEESLELEAGDYTVAAIGEVAEDSDTPLQPLVLEDDNSPVADDNSRVQLVHASPDAPAVDVVVADTGDPVFEDVGFGEAGTVEVPAGEYDLEIRPAGEEDVVAEISVELMANCVYSAFAVGYVSPEEAPVEEPFDVLVASTQPEEPVASIGATI